MPKALRRTCIRAAASILVLGLGAASAAACGGGGGGGSKAESDSPATVAPRSINGRITYDGAALANHKIVIAVNQVGANGAPAYSAVVAKTGPFTIANVADGSYSLIAFIDLGDDMGSPQANEPMGQYDAGADGTADLVVLKDGTAAQGVDIVIKDRGR